MPLAGLQSRVRDGHPHGRRPALLPELTTGAPVGRIFSDRLQPDPAPIARGHANTPFPNAEFQEPCGDPSTDGCTSFDHLDAAMARESEGPRRSLLPSWIACVEREEVRMTRPRSAKSSTAQTDARTAEIAAEWWAGLTSCERESWTERLVAQGEQATPDAAMALYGVDMYWAAVRRHRERQEELVADRTRIRRCGTSALL